MTTKQPGKEQYLQQDEVATTQPKAAAPAPPITPPAPEPEPEPRIRFQLHPGVVKPKNLDRGYWQFKAGEERFEIKGSFRDALKLAYDRAEKVQANLDENARMLGTTSHDVVLSYIGTKE